MLKLYTSYINQFLEHHCEVNDIVTTEQAGGKKEVWGCPEQLLINKTRRRGENQPEIARNHVARLPKSF